MNKLMYTKQFAIYLGKSESTLIQYCANGTGPKHVKQGCWFRCALLDVEEWPNTKKLPDKSYFTGY